MTTARDIVTQSLRDAGVVSLGNAPSAEQITQGLVRLNQMIYQWRRSRWLIYVLTRTSFNMTGTTGGYTVGPGGNYNLDPRPDRLEDGCRVVQLSPPAPNQVAWPLIIVPSYENYQKITMQGLGSMPRYIFYRSDFPTARIFPWPVPSSLYAVEILTKAVLQSFASLNTDVELPLEYETAMSYNLQVRHRMAYRMAPDIMLNKMANATLNAIKIANIQVPTLMMPRELAYPSNYNIYSDQSS